jgi:hypothetical protein
VSTVIFNDMGFFHSPSLSTASIQGMQYTLTSLN